MKDKELYQTDNKVVENESDPTGDINSAIDRLAERAQREITEEGDFAYIEEIFDNPCSNSHFSKAALRIESGGKDCFMA
ncbi:MAG: hypothetical protein LBQ70_04960 [Prevotellaceae bacterium]|jgi:hypothetical protein|nr:hypothetical protein [Prevotellaceae bacterium]